MAPREIDLREALVAVIEESEDLLDIFDSEALQLGTAWLRKNLEEIISAAEYDKRDQL